MRTTITGDRLRYVVGAFMLAGRIDDDVAREARAWLGEVTRRCRMSADPEWPASDGSQYEGMSGSELQETIREEQKAFDDARFGQDYEIIMPPLPETLLDDLASHYDSDVSERVGRIVRDVASEPQPCGHPMAARKRAEHGGTYCSDCLPDGSQRTYITHNARQIFADPRLAEAFIVASSPVQALGKVLVSPHGTKEEAIEFADGLEQLPVYVLAGPDGEVIHEREVE